MFDHLHLFCDEAGNTGPDYLNRDQPYYVAAGFGVPDTRLDECRALVAAAIAERGGDELKGSELVGGAPGREFICDLLDGLYALEAAGVFVIVEKRYALAAWFVNLFLDADADGNESVKYNRNPEIQTAAAQAICTLPLQSLRPTVDAIRNPTEANQDAARDAVLRALEARGETELAAEIAAAALRSPMFDADDEAEAKRDMMSRTPNTTAYMTIVGNFQQIADGVGASQVDFVHDETSSFQEILQHNHKLATDPVQFARMRPWLDAVNFPWLSLIDKTAFVPSETEPMVQAADLLGAALVHVSKSAHRSRPLDDSSLRLFKLALRPQAQDGLPFRWFVVSEQWWERVSRYGQRLQEETTRRAAYRAERE